MAGKLRNAASNGTYEEGALLFVCFLLWGGGGGGGGGERGN